MQNDAGRALEVDKNMQSDVGNCVEVDKIYKVMWGKLWNLTKYAK